MSKMTLEEKRSKAISDAFDLNNAIHMLEKAETVEEIRLAISLIPGKVIVKLSPQFRAFGLRDMTRTELIVHLKKQLVSLKKSMKRYIELVEKETEQVG